MKNIKYDLKKIEEKFHEFLGSDCEGFYRLEDLSVTEELFRRGKSVHVPFGEMRYRLKVVYGEVVLEVRTFSRMEGDEVCFIYEDEIRRCDLFGVYGAERRRKIESLKRKPEGFVCEVCEGLTGRGFYTCPRCGREVFDFNYSDNLRIMEEKYGTDDFLKLSQCELTFQEIITIYSFIERCERHCGDTLTSDKCRNDGPFANLKRRLKKIRRDEIINR